MDVKKTKDFIKQVGLRIQDRRENFSMTNAQLSDICHLSKEYIAEVECGARVLSFTALKRISKALQIPPEIIITGGRFHPPHYTDKKTLATLRRIINMLEDVNSKERKLLKAMIPNRMKKMAPILDELDRRAS